LSICASDVFTKILLVALGARPDVERRAPALAETLRDGARVRFGELVGKISRWLHDLHFALAIEFVDAREITAHVVAALQRDEPSADVIKCRRNVTVFRQ